jgi:simple sugar transport system substrate-binding protein
MSSFLAAIPYDFEDACEVKPEICLGTPYFNWGPAYMEYVHAVRGGKFKQEWKWEAPYWKDIHDGDKTIVGYKFGPALSADDQKHLEEYMRDLGKGKVKLFVGPLNLQDGTPFLDAGQKATDDEIWYLPQLLEGMEGASS